MEGLQEIGVPLKDQPVEIAHIPAMLQSKSYEEVHHHIAHLMQQELHQMQLEEQQARYEDVDLIES